MGIPKKLIIGDNTSAKKSINPEPLNVPIATNKPINVGKSEITILAPSFAPSKNKSNTFTFSLTPYNNIIVIIIGIIELDKKFIYFITTISLLIFLR